MRPEKPVGCNIVDCYALLVMALEFNLQNSQVEFKVGRMLSHGTILSLGHTRPSPAVPCIASTGSMYRLMSKAGAVCFMMQVRPIGTVCAEGFIQFRINV